MEGNIGSGKSTFLQYFKQIDTVEVIMQSVQVPFSVALPILHIFYFVWLLLPLDAMLSEVYAVIMCLCVCLSVSLRYCIKTARRRITQIMPHDSTGTLVF